MSASYGRPQPRRVNALFDPGQPRAAQGLDRQSIDVTANGRLQDFSSVETAGKNATRGFSEVANFLEQTGDAFKPAYEAYLKNEVDKEIGLVLAQDEGLSAYRNGDEAQRAFVSRMRPQTQYYVNEMAAQSSTYSFAEIYNSLSLNNSVRQQSGSTEEELSAARNADRSRAWNESGLANLDPRFLRGVGAAISNTEANTDARLADLRNKDAKAIQDSKIAAGLGTTYNLAVQADYLQSQRPASSGEDLALTNQQYRDSKTESWRQMLQELEENRTSTEAATLAYRGGNEAVQAALGSGNSKDVDAALNISDQMWQLVNNTDVKTANGQVLGQVVITRDGKTFRQIVAEQRMKLQPLREDAEVDAIFRGIAGQAAQMLRAKASPSAVMQFLQNNIRNEDGNPDFQMIGTVWSTLGNQVTVMRQPTDEQLLLERDLEVKLRTADSKAEKQGYLNEAANAGLTPEQQLRLGRLSGGGDDETKRLSDAEKLTKGVAESYIEQLKLKSGGATDAEVEVDLLTKAQEIQDQKVKDFVEANKGIPPSRDEFNRLYRDSLDEAARAIDKDYGGKGEALLDPGQQIEQELNIVQQNIQRFTSEGISPRIREVFSPELRQRAVAAGEKDTYLGVQKFLMNSMLRAKDKNNKPLFPNAPTLWQQLTRQASSGGQKQDNTNISSPSSDSPKSLIEMLVPGIKTRGNGEGDQSSVQPANVFGQFLTAVAGGRPAQAGTLEGKPTVDNPDAMADLAAVVSGKRDLGLQTLPLPQSPANTPAPAVPAQISTDTHPFFLAIGIAEGTRTPDGGYTQAYYGHTDPGNGARNVGTVSSQQYGNPDVADRVWAGRLSALATRMTPVLFQMGVKPGTVAFNRLMFNRLDLEVQSPAAGADLFRNLTGDYSIEGIAKARADSFINPVTGQLEAGGFGGSYNRLFTDQRSRAGAFDYKRRF